MRWIILAAALVASAGCRGEAEQPVVEAGGPQYRIDKLSLPGDGRGDYILVDHEASRLFVTHTHFVHILDVATLKEVARVEGLTKAHGVALAAGKGFASDGDGNAIVVFDPGTGKTIKVLPAGRNPDSILFDRPSGMVFVFNGASKDVSILDPNKEEIVRTIPVGDKPEFARSDDKGRIYFNMEEDHAIGVIDTKAGKVIGKFVLDDCEGPAALGLDAANDRLFSSCGNGTMKIVDARTGKIVAEVPVGEDPDGIVYDAAHERVVVAARDGKWTIVEQRGPDRYAVNQDLAIDPYAKTLAIDEQTGRLFSSTADLVWPKAQPGKELLPDAARGTFRLMVATPQ